MQLFPALVVAVRTVGLLAFLILHAIAGTSRATPVVIRIFNLGSTTAYTVQLNAGTVDTQATSDSGVLAERLEASAGDRIVLEPNQSLAPPPPPIFTSAIISDDNCVELNWVPSGDPTVVGYLISYGVLSVAADQAPRYQYSVEVGAIASRELCGLKGSTVYFAVQAVNYAGQLSAYSTELSAGLSSLPVLISTFDARAFDGGVRLSWRVFADEVVSGYYLYRSRGRSPQERLFDQLLPPDAESYLDTSVRGGSTYAYVLVAVKADGSEVHSVPVSATTPALALALDPNAPNPFSQSTRVPFTLERTSRVTLTVYDVRGARVATLFDGTLPEGRHEIDWTGRDNAGRPVASGTYFYALTADKTTRSRKLQILR